MIAIFKPDNFADLQHVTDLSRRFLSCLLCLCLQEASRVDQDACSDGCNEHHRNEDDKRPNAHLAAIFSVEHESLRACPEQVRRILEDGMMGYKHPLQIIYFNNSAAGAEINFGEPTMQLVNVQDYPAFETAYPPSLARPVRVGKTKPAVRGCTPHRSQCYAEPLPACSCCRPLATV